MNNTFGFIGCGNMGGSLATAVCKSVGSDKVFLADKNSATLDILADKLNCEKASSLEIAEKCKYIFLGVKPQVMSSALGEIKDTLRLRNDRFILVSMLAGTEISAIKEELGFDDITKNSCQECDILTSGSYIIQSDNFQERIDSLR